MTLSNLLTPQIQNAVQLLFGFSIEKVEFQTTRREFEGDITIVLFPFLKFYKGNPMEMGEKLGTYLVNEVKEVSKFNVVKGFLNLVIDESYYVEFFHEIQDMDHYGFVENSEDTNAVMVEYSSPNTNKPLHLGHVISILYSSPYVNILATYIK
jgi:arginyl-tRNA synthetase